MLKYLASIIKNPKLLTTYHTGLVQAHAFRILKKRTNDLLTPYDLSTVEWALLGMLYEQKAGIRSKEAAELLSVDQPFVTVLLSHLKKLGLVEVNIDTQDARVKIVSLTPAGKTLVPKLEKILREGMRPLLKNLSIKELITYFKVLNFIVENEKALRKNRE